MTITKEQWNEVKHEIKDLSERIDILSTLLGNIASDIDYLRYKRIPDLERRTEHGTNYDNH